MKSIQLFPGLCCLLLCGLLGAADVLPLSGRRVAVVQEKTDNAVVDFAAKELALFLSRTLGSEVKIGNGKGADVRFYVGYGSQAVAAGITVEDGIGRISVQDNGDVFLLGKDSPVRGKMSPAELLFDVEFKGTLEAVYTFLEEYLGVRWLEPGPEGEYVPARKTVSLAVGSKILNPALTERRCFHYYSLRYWKYNGKPMDLDEYCSPEEAILWGLRLRHTSQAARSQGAHSVGYLWGFAKLIETRPELFALQKDGTRSDRDMCWSNPELADLFYDLADCYFSGEPTPVRCGLEDRPWNVHQFTRKDEFMVDPEDYITYCCKCPRCREFMEPRGDKGRGELIFRTVFNVAERIGKKYPGKYITTLVHPPKYFVPEAPVPSNVRIRLAGNSPMMNTDGIEFRKNMDLLKAWYHVQQAPVQLWLYAIADFGGEFHGVPEVTANNFQKYLKAALPYIDGVFFEHLEPSQTMRNMDAYCLAHILWDVNVDLDKLRREYCELCFGKGAEAMLDFFLSIERNWTKVLEIRQKVLLAQDTIGPSNLLPRIFDEIFTYDELARLGQLLDTADAQTRDEPVVQKRISRYRRHVLELAQQTFGRYVTDKSRLFKQPDVLFCGIGAGTASDLLQRAPWQPLHELSAGAGEAGRFRMVSSENGLWIETDFPESRIADSATRKVKAPGSDDFWFGNLAEIFIAPSKDGKLFHLAIDDSGDALLYDAETQTVRHELGAISVQHRKTGKSWGFLVWLPHEMTGLGPNVQGARINLTRTRSLKKGAQVYFSASKDAKIGCWDRPEYYFTLVFQKLEKNLPAFSGIAGKSSGKTAVKRLSSSSMPFYSWVTPPGKSVLKEEKASAENGRMFSVDSRLDSAFEKELGASWRCEVPAPAAGRHVRVSVLMRAETSSPNASVYAMANWCNGEHAWYTAKDYSGTASLPATGEWQRVTMDFTVPDCPEIQYLSVVFGCRQLRPGRLWITGIEMDEVK